MPLSAKQKAFIDEYLQCWNATRAAEMAGYAHPNKQGSRLLVNVGISEEIQRRVNERAMSANEALLLLAEHARGDMGEYITDEGEIDIAAMKGAKATKLLRKVKFTRRMGTNKDGDTWENVTVEAELHNAQSALELIGKTHKLFTEKVDVNHSGNVTTSEVTIYLPDNGRDGANGDTRTD